ncbi:MAG: HTTM domain-containing protein [Deltaproteobacteria bacterium]|nr:HTTM domain-containing protein [Deltaproteobacteria bacterium]
MESAEADGPALERVEVGPSGGTPGPSFRERLRRARRWFAARYLVADPRTLGLARIVVGLLLCANTLRHWNVAERYYSNDGVLSTHYLLYRPSTEFNFSLFSAFATSPEVHVAFAAALVCHACFTLGLSTRVFSILSCVWATSLDQRLILVENGGYVVVNLLTFWLAFLPTGKRFSVDAWRRARREHRADTVADLARRHRPPWWTAEHRSLASFAIVVNLGIVYVFNVVNKYGDTWRRGSTVHYVLHLDRMVTGLAVALREHLPYPAMQAAAHLTLVVEALLAVLILWPSHRRLARPLAMALMAGLHGTLGVLMRLGPFSWFMIGWSTLLLQRTHWEAIEASHRRRFAVTLALAPERPLALRLGRLLAALDATDSITFVEGTPRGPLLEARLRGETRTGIAAYRAALRALPGGPIAVVVVALLSLGLDRAIVHLVEAHPERIERFFGWDLREPPLVTAHAGHLPVFVTRLRVGLRETVLAFFLVCAVSALIHDNKSTAPVLKHAQPWLLRAALGYPRIFQGWGMFAPNPVREDGVGAIDAYTIDGRRIDPLTGGEPDLDLSDARGLGLGQIEQDYWNRIRLDRNRVYHKPLGDYLRAWHERTGSPQDELVAFDVWWLRDRCPDPGNLTPTDHERVCLMSWRKPGYRTPPGTPSLPPRCKEASAEKKDGRP